MPIKKATAFVASDGTAWEMVEDAQRRELELIFKGSDRLGRDYSTNEAVQEVLSNADAILDILTTGPRSRPAMRKKAGTTAPKRAARRATDPDKTALLTPDEAISLAAKAGFKAMREAVEAGTSTLSKETVDKAEEIALAEGGD